MMDDFESDIATDMTALPNWKRPDEVMKLHKLKQKKRALQARMGRRDLFTKSESSSSGPSGEEVKKETEKRKNPFKYEKSKRHKEDTPASLSIDCELSSDNTLFQLLNNTTVTRSQETSHTSFASILSQSTSSFFQEASSKQEPVQPSHPFIPIDWTLKTKVRFTSSKPFTWNVNLRTCEEASGITGFVRCLDTGQSSRHSLDTSPKARFHQCCLVWQHPALPWLELFPRKAARVSSTINNIIASSQVLRESMHKEWSESFRSLFQLLRARQCPYFYVCADTFTCLFRAAGICGLTDIHALLTPTTRGFRQALKEEDVMFTMPLKKSSQTFEKRLSTESANDTGYSTLDSEDSQRCGEDEIEEKVEVDEDDDETPDEWLQSMGIGAEVIKKIKINQTKIDHHREREVDRTPESLVYVEGVETQALFNFLMNCKSAVSATGPLAGVPPTLLAPVAFYGATLRSLKARQNKVIIENEKFHSLELRGAILPHTIHYLCGLLEQSLEEYSVTFANVDSTRPFSLMREIAIESPETNENLGCVDTETSPEKSRSSTISARTPTKAPVPSVFGKESLSDCGLHTAVLETFCSSDSCRIAALDSLRCNSDGTYSWS